MTKIDQVLDGYGNWGEENKTEWPSTVDKGNNHRVSGSGA